MCVSYFKDSAKNNKTTELLKIKTKKAKQAFIIYH